MNRPLDGGDVEWVAADKRLPETGAVVLVISQRWANPMVCEFLEKPHPRFRNPDSGRWYWYPERMYWSALPLPPLKARKASQGTAAT